MPEPPDNEFEAIKDRDRALADRLGLPVQLFFSNAIPAAVAFTLAAPADPNVRHWRQWGARNIGGRIRVLVQNPRNPSVFYAGSAQGGVFRSGDGGDTWSSIGAPADSFPVGAMALDPSNPSILYVGTGEPLFIGAGPRGPAGRGFFQYNDATGLFVNEVGPAIPPAPVGGFPAGAANSYAQISPDPRTPGRCWIASHTGLWRRELGPVFNPEAVPVAATPATDVVVIPDWNPAQPSTHRVLVTFAGAGIFRGVFNPVPAPATAWELAALANFAPAVPAFDRIRLAVCVKFPNHIYAVFGDPAGQAIVAVYHSNDGGDHWTRCVPPPPVPPGFGALGSQASWCLNIAVHPENPGIVVVGNVNMARSLDFGATWQTIIDGHNHTSVDRAQHGDTHAPIFDLRDPNQLWVGNDGGISFTPDIVDSNPLTSRTWRKRSHGLCASQFNDITVHPNYPFMMGGGLQDNATYLTFGGPTWTLAGFGDGGQMCFEIDNPRQFVSTSQGDTKPYWASPAVVVAPSFVDPVPQVLPAVATVRSPMADLPGPGNDVIAILISTSAVAGGMLGLFVQTAVHHRVQPKNLMIGRVTDVAYSINGGANYALAASGAGGKVTALAYGLGDDATASDWWIGTDNAKVMQGTGAPPKAWAARVPPGLVGVVTAIAVHPGNGNYIVVATGGDAGAITQGRVYLSNNAGTNWMDITGLAAAFVLPGVAPGGIAGPLTSLPPCPISCLAFDPTIPAGNPQVLFAGTLAGLYVMRNLPLLPAGLPPPIALPAAFNPNWLAFNGPAAAPLPLTLVNDIELVTLPARPGAAANSPESVQRLRLYAAMYGRGIFASDITPYPAAMAIPGGPPRRLFIRQHSIEDGLAYPRATPDVMNTAPAAPNYNLPQMGGDPRLPALPVPMPASPPVGAFNDISAMDIRVDNEPFQFFDEVLDGVEFDESLHTKNLAPGSRNAIYVQVHNAGWDRFANTVDVHLFFAPGAPFFLPGGPPAAGANLAPLPDLHHNFWANFTVEPQLPPSDVAPVLPVAQWQRTGGKQTIPAGRLSAAYPAVVRFEWIPPVSLANGFVALLAVCTAAEDPLPAAAMPPVMLTLIRQERRVAFRLLVSDPFVPDVFIRDSVEDDGRLTSGSPAGRSPDIIVIQSAEATPNAAFADLLDVHNGDRIRPGVDQFIYVRVHNRRDVGVQADIDVLWVKPNAATTAADAHAPAFDGTKWTSLTPVGHASTPVPANGWAIANLRWQAADVPAPDATAGAFNAIGFVALVSSAEGAQDRAPAATRVRDAASFWDFFSRTSDSNNAAFRAVLYGGA